MTRNPIPYTVDLFADEHTPRRVTELAYALVKVSRALADTTDARGAVTIQDADILADHLCAVSGSLVRVMTVVRQVAADGPDARPTGRRADDALSSARILRADLHRMREAMMTDHQARTALAESAGTPGASAATVATAVALGAGITDLDRITAMANAAFLAGEAAVKAARDEVA